MSAVSAADNPSDNQTSVSVNHATNTETSTYQNKTNKDLSINTTKSSNKNVKDPQIWDNGIPVSRGGQPAGYDWGTIQNAINNADPDDTIMLENGVTFSGSGNTQISLTKNLNFDVLDGGTATIDGGGSRWGFIVHSGITATFNNIIFQNMFYILSGGALENDGGTLTVNNCILRDNQAIIDGGAIYNHNNGNLNVNYCSIYNNRAGAGSGIYTTGSGTVNIANNQIYSNNNGDGTGICVNSGNPNITGNNIYSNYWRGIYILSGNAAISNNNIHNNGHATRSGDGIHIDGGNPVITGNNIRNNAEDGIHADLFSGSSSNPLQIHYNSIVDNGEWGLHVMNGVYVNAIYNWWGTNAPNYIRQLLDPSHPRDIFEQRLSISSQRVTWNPYLYLRIMANTPIYNGDSSTVTAYLTTDNNNNLAPGTVPDGTTVNFSLTDGPYGSLTLPLTRSTTGGIANILFTANDPNAPHTQTVMATVDHQSVTTGILIDPKAHVTMTKTSNGPVYVGQSGTFTVTITNNGPNDATDVTVTDPPISGFTYTPTIGTYDLGTGIWTIGTLANGASATLTITKNPMAPGDVGTIPNTATETQTTYNPTPITPQTANLIVNPVAHVTMTKTGNGPLNVGQTGTFTINIHNNGPNDAENIQVTDPLPSGFTLGSYSIGTYIGNVWTIPLLSNGASATLTFNRVMTSADAGTTKTNTATETQTTYNPTPITPQTATIYINNAMLSIIKTADKENYNVGNSATYNIDVKNNGPDTATNVIVTDTLQSGLTYVSSTLGGSYNTLTQTITWNLANLASGQHFLPSFTATVNHGTQGQTITNTVSAYSDQITTPVISNSADIKVNKAALSINKISDKTKYNVGDTVVYNIDVTNNGPDIATNVTVTDTLPYGMTYVNSTKGGMWDLVTRTITWTVGNLASSAHFMTTVTATITASGGQSLVNTAQASNDQMDNPVSTTSSVYIKKCQLYVKVIPSFVNTTVGKIFTITYKVGNKGPDEANNVVMTFVIPNGLEFVSAFSPDSAQPTYDAATRMLTWIIGDVPVGDPILKLNLKALKVGTFIVSSTLVSSTYSDQPVIVSGVTVNVQKKVNPHVNPENNTIGMQNTGTPIMPLILAALMAMVGIILPKRKK